MFYRNHNDSKHTNIRIVSLAAGLALATAAVIGGSDLLKENHNSNSNTSPFTPRVERIAPQFGTSADAVYASQGIRTPSRFATAADATYDALGLAYIRSVSIPDAAVVAGDDALGIGQAATGQSFATAADAVHAAQSIVADVSVIPNAAIDARDQALGLGQPAVGQSFGTEADAVYATESMLAGQEVTSSVTSENLDNYLGLGQPGEGSNAGPQFGTMADADYASR